MENEITLAERRKFKKLINSTCKNTVPDYSKSELSGCTNPRRNGSAWCQKCSDDYKQKSK